MMIRWFVAVCGLAALAVSWPAHAVNQAPAIRITTLASNVTTDTTSVAVQIPSPEPKTFWGQVVCTSGACTQTQAIYGDVDSDAANGLLLCTLTLTATTRDQDVCAGTTASYLYYYVVTTNTSGTAAKGSVYAMY